jgi:acetolactate synthase small subunit
MNMTRTAEKRWAALKPEVKRRWAQLTDEDIDDVKVNVERLLDVLQVRHGYNRSLAEREVALWSQSLAAGQAQTGQRV